jgi:uncharacterized protein YndB with AHSA1/START domain
MDTGIHKTFFVPWQPQEAFHLFVNCIGDWWPLETHTLAKKDKGEHAVSVVIEPHKGARFYEVLSDGHTHIDWGEVLNYVPGEFIILKWQLGRPEAQATQLEVIFSPAGTQTKIDLLHKQWEKFGDEAAAMQKKYESGWDAVLARFVTFAKTHEAA